jgi:hypothetical protein
MARDIFFSNIGKLHPVFEAFGLLGFSLFTYGIFAVGSEPPVIIAQAACLKGVNNGVNTQTYFA